MMLNQQIEDFDVKENVDQKGFGLFARKSYQIGDAIYQFDYWSKEKMPMHMTNHSCNPNGKFNDEGMLIALRNIAKGEEITFDYLITPIPASPWNFKCQCKSENCKGWIMVISK